MAASPVASFLDGLRELLPARQVEEIARWPQAQGSDPRVFAQELVQRDLLTSYQASQLVQGKGKDLVIGPYVVLEKLGEGGMGQVFKARHQTMGRLVALKVIRKEKLNRPDAIRRFNQEIQLASTLRHPNIVLAYDAGQGGGTYYFAMEYVDGTDLDRQVKQHGPLAVGQACDYVRQAALGLQHAHEQGLVHRDIKPHNLLVTPKPGTGTGPGTVKVLDMGLARIQDQETGLTRIGALLGTPSYVAPEQARDSHASDIRSDLYSLGCTLFYLLAGRPPFQGQSVPEVLIKHQSDEPPPLSKYRADVPLEVQAIVRKLLAKKPEERYQAPKELATTLEPFCKTSAVTSNGATDRQKSKKLRLPRGRTAKGSGRRSVLRRAASAAGLAGLIALGAGYSLGLFSAAETPESVAVVPPVAATNTDREPTAKVAKVGPPPATRKTGEPKIDPNTDPPPQPKDKTLPKTEPRVELKVPVPEPDLLDQARAAVHAKYKDDYSKTEPNERRDLADRLWKASNATDDPALRFVLLREARDVACLAADMALFYFCMDLMQKYFEVDRAVLTTEAFEAASRSMTVTNAVLKNVGDQALKLVDKQLEAENYELGGRLLVVTVAAAERTQQPALVSQARARLPAVAELAKEYPQAKSAAATLKSNPDDPEACATWGRFLCCLRGKWDVVGLSLLVKGNNESLKSLARRDLAQAHSPEVKAMGTLANDWFKFGTDQSGLTRRNVLERSRHWYKLVLPHLTAADSSMSAVRRRLNKDIDEALANDGETKPLPKTPEPVAGRAREEYDKAMLAGDSAFAGRRFSEALKYYDFALNKQPFDAKAIEGVKKSRYEHYMANGRELMIKKQFVAAAAEFNKAFSLVQNDRDPVRREDARRLYNDAQAMQKK